MRYGFKLIRSAGEAEAAFRAIGVSPEGCHYMKPKALFGCLTLKDLPCPAANALKQEMLARGGDAAVNARAIRGEGRTDVLLMGTYRQYALLADKLRRQPFRSLQRAAEVIEETLLALAEPLPSALVFPDGRQMSFEQTRIMGILNVTPDSFSDGGRYADPGRAAERAWELRAEGADIIDIGAVSTRPGGELASAKTEWARLKPVLQRLGQEPELILSVDTFRAGIASRALDAGAAMINDVSGFSLDERMPETAAARRAPVVVTDNRLQLNQTPYQELMVDIADNLRHSVERGLEHGLARSQIIIDPGAGFGKTAEQNWRLIDRLAELRALGQPILLAVSRKGFIRRALALAEPDQAAADEATAAAGVAGILNGANLLRVHDVKRMKAAALVADMVKGGRDG
jgi:dihydropteroate synthase